MDRTHAQAVSFLRLCTKLASLATQQESDPTVSKATHGGSCTAQGLTLKYSPAVDDPVEVVQAAVKDKDPHCAMAHPPVRQGRAVEVFTACLVTKGETHKVAGALADMLQPAT